MTAGVLGTASAATFESDAREGILQRVRAAGIPIIPDQIVQQHMRELDGRASASKLENVLRDFIAVVLWWRFASYVLGRRSELAVCLAMLLTFSTVMVLLSLAVQHMLVFFALIVYLPLILLGGWIGERRGCWMHTTNLQWLKAPSNIVARTQQLDEAGIPWFVSFWKSDPILFAGPSRCCVPVGGWGTHKAAIDNL